MSIAISKSSLSIPPQNSFAYWRGIIDPGSILKVQWVADKFFQFLENPHLNGANLERLKNSKVYSIRTSDKGRILFTDYINGGKKYLLILDYLPNHEYHKSKFLKSNVLKNFCTNMEVNKEEEWETLSFVDYSETQTLPFENGYTPFAVDSFNSAFITLNRYQNEVINAQLPILVSGPPGSGKSCTALSSISHFMDDPSNINDKSVVFVCFSENLAQTMREYWEEQPASQVEGDTKIEFTSYRTLLGKHLFPLVEVVEEETLEWIKQKSDFDPKSVIEEFQILSSMDEEAYKQLGQRQCLYQEAIDKQQLLNLFDDYQYWLKENGWYDIRFVQLNLENPHDFIVVDEAQDFSPRALMNLYHFAGGKVAYFMDTQQDLEDSLSKRNHLKQMMYTNNITLNSVRLNSVYRCPLSVLKLANLWLDIKAYISGGISDKDEYRSIDIEESQVTEEGSISWVTENISESIDELLKKHKKTEVAVVVPNHEWKNHEDVKHLKKVYLFTPEEIKGLEFEAVIYCKPFDSEEFKKINKRLSKTDRKTLKKQQNRAKPSHMLQLGESSFSPKLNTVFTVLTRSKKSLVIYQPINHDNEVIHQLLKPAFTEHITSLKTQGECSSSNSKENTVETTIEDWINQAKEYHKLGLIDKFNEVCEEFGIPPESIVKKTNQHITLGNSSVAKPSKSQMTRRSNKKRKKVKKKSNRKKAKNIQKQENPSHKVPTFIASKLNGGSFLKVYHDGETLTPTKEDYSYNASDDSEALVTSFISGFEPTSNGLKDFEDAAYKGNISLIKKYLNLGTNSFSELKESSNALGWAVMKGHQDVVKYLLEKGFDPNKKMNNEYLPLVSSAYSGFLNVVNLLIKHGANVDLQDGGGCTALAQAVLSGHVDIVKSLLKNGANVNITQGAGNSPLMMAVRKGYESIIEILLNNNAEVDLKNSVGKSALIVAVAYGNESIVEVLLANNANIDLEDEKGITPLMTAVSVGEEAIAKLLLRHHANVNKQDNQGKTALTRAAEDGNLSMLKAILKHNPNASLRTINGESAVNIAMNNDHGDIAAILMNYILGQKSKS